MKKIIPIFVVLLVLVGGSFFYGGMKYGSKTRQSNFAANRNGMGNFQNGVGGNLSGGMRRVGAGAEGATFASGEVVSKDDKSITIKLRDGGSRIVFFSASTTQVMKSVNGSIDDIKIGETIMVNGSANQDGSFTGKSVQLNGSSTFRF